MPDSIVCSACCQPIRQLHHAQRLRGRTLHQHQHRYTHLRRIKEQAGCQRLPEPICRLAELRGLPVDAG